MADQGSTQTVVEHHRRNTTPYVSEQVVEDGLSDVSDAPMTVLSPIATRSRARAVTAHDTPETGRHDCDNNNTPILLEITDTSLQEDKLAESSLVADIRSPVSKCADEPYTLLQLCFIHHQLLIMLALQMIPYLILTHLPH